MDLESRPFHSQPASPELCALLETEHPVNPFFSSAYVEARIESGTEAVILGCGDGSDLVNACIAYVQRGRLRTWMTLPSVPAAAPATFWDGMLRFASAQDVTDIEIATFASRDAVIPPLPGEVARIDRIEFALRLPDKDLFAALGKSHRERVKKAARTGVSIRRGAEASYIDAHVALHLHSMDRRRLRGESAPDSFERDSCARFLETGAGELFQAVSDGTVFSSLLVLRSKRGAYSESSGNSPEGMKVGASHFLRYEVARILQDEGTEIFFLGGVRPSETGLWSYKAGFGAEQLPMQSVVAYSGGAVRRALSDLNELRSAAPRRIAQRIGSVIRRHRDASPT